MRMQISRIVLSGMMSLIGVATAFAGPIVPLIKVIVRWRDECSCQATPSKG